MAGDHSSCAIFVLISMLRGQPKTPPSGDDLAVLDYHLKVQVAPKKPSILSPATKNIAVIKVGSIQQLSRTRTNN